PAGVAHLAGGLSVSPTASVGIAAAFTFFAQARTLEDRAPIELEGRDEGLIASFEEVLDETEQIPAQIAEELPDVLGVSAARAFIGHARFAMGGAGTGGDTG